MGQATAEAGKTFGIWGQSASGTGTGVHGAATAVDGRAIGVSGSSLSKGGTGTLGWATSATGILGYSGPAPRPDGLPGTGVYGSALQDDGRGGVFGGRAAQLRLLPQDGPHPATGELGDLFLDAAGDLWLCKGGTTWKQVA